MMKLGKGMTNLEIAELLRAVAAAYQLKDEKANKFKIIAYQRAADAVEHASSELKDLWDDKKLDEVAGIGKSIASHLDELFRKGKSTHFEFVMKGLPSSMFELMKVPGIGVKTAYKLVKELGIKSYSDLRKAASSGKISKLEGFGENSEASILKSLSDFEKKPLARHLLPYAMEIAGSVISWLKQNKDVLKADPLGSLRRQASTVGDIDISVASTNSDSVVEHFTAYPKASRVLEKGQRTASLILAGNIQVDLMVAGPKGYGSLLQHFTGSKHHNITLRERALKMGLSVSDYGIKNLKSKDKKLELFPNEEDFYKRLGLEWIPPELREDMGEIEASRRGKLPKLIELQDIKADLQIHSSFDIETSHDLGESSMKDIIKKADALGYEYLAFTEHNPSKSRHSPQQIIDILKRKKEKVDQLNYSIMKNRAHNRGTSPNRVNKVFNSLEIDMLPQGGIPVPEKGLETLDFALISIHSSFDLPRHEMTQRVIRSFSHPKVKIFAHPTARKINYREGVELDWPMIFEFCIKNNKCLEINADPGRLDLPDVLVHEAIKLGVMLTLGTDAHHVDGMNNMIFGVSVARRGWAQESDIINTRSLKDFEKLIKD